MGNPLLRDFSSKHSAPAAPQYGQAPYGQQQYGQAPQYGQQQYGQAPSAEQMQGWYDSPAASGEQTGRMTLDDVIMRTSLTLGTVIVFAVVGWMFPVLAFPAALVGLVLGLVNSFKREPSVPLIMLYAVAEGLFVGGISGIFQNVYPGIVLQAVIGTIGVFVAVLALYRMRILRTSPRLTKIVIVAMIGYLVFALANFGLSMFAGFNVRSDIEIFGIPLGVFIGGIAILLAAYSLVMDFESIERGIGRVARKYAWSAAFGLTVTLIWLYVEILRILSLLQQD
ncbi:Bax inhibitor-1/YccA family protein [Kocuria sp. JC486]|uniref:Bax inhibitor-1/YccA family protein n=1 Tax=Kocuria soli TaxID=2485125 RepID=A0A3N3ZUR0_9MICC|nr:MULTISPECIES: Bax inhibitor-1/YccA family protein [Kocuria]NHU85315.1 Bax inhibitor-1/YccA family protein [Kocuria sp. JC486]ROZ61969.1 Bax inhibitor-1/YccA family protein [Kocuria soli]